MAGMGLRRTDPLDGESTSDRTPLRSIRGGRSGGGARLRRAARDRRGQGDPARCASDRRRRVDGLEPRSDRRTMDGDVHVASRRAPRSISRGRVVDRSLPHTCGCWGPASSLGGIDQGPRHRSGTRARLPVPPRRSGRHRHAEHTDRVYRASATVLLVSGAADRAIRSGSADLGIIRFYEPAGSSEVMFQAAAGPA